MSWRPLIVLGLVGLLTAGCGTAPRAATRTEAAPAPTLMYTCCTAATEHRVYRPGDTVTLRWMRSTGGQGRDTGTETLRAHLDGPYRKAARARASDGLGNIRAAAQTVQVGPNSPAPVSRLRIPAGATPGLYAVITTDVQGPGTLTTKTVIRVVAGG